MIKQASIKTATNAAVIPDADVLLDEHSIPATHLQRAARPDNLKTNYRAIIVPHTSKYWL